MTSEGLSELGAAVLHTRFAIGTQGEGEVGSVEILLHDHLSAQQVGDVGCRQDFIVSRLRRAESGQMGRVREAEEVGQGQAVMIGKTGFGPVTSEM